MSHQDIVTKIPSGFKKIASTQNSKFAIISNEKKKLYGVQFHPEVTHTKNGKIILKNFVLNICKTKKMWSLRKQKDLIINEIKNKVKKCQKVICALSGGVDSSVVAFLLNKAIGKKLKCVFINTGFLRKNEEKEVVKTFRKKTKI